MTIDDVEDELNTQSLVQCKSSSIVFGYFDSKDKHHMIIPLPQFESSDCAKTMKHDLSHAINDSPFTIRFDVEITEKMLRQLSDSRKCYVELDKIKRKPAMKFNLEKKKWILADKEMKRCVREDNNNREADERRSNCPSSALSSRSGENSLESQSLSDCSSISLSSYSDINSISPIPVTVPVRSSSRLAFKELGFDGDNDNMHGCKRTGVKGDVGGSGTRKRPKSESPTPSGSDEASKENKNNLKTELNRLLGLPNLGNTCYLNCIIHVLRFTPGFVEFVHKLKDKMVQEGSRGIRLKTGSVTLVTYLHEIFSYLSKEITEKNTKLAKKTIDDFMGSIDEEFQSGQQHDSHEFLNWLITSLNYVANFLAGETNPSNPKSRPRPKVCFDHFEGKLRERISCLGCHNCKFHDVPFSDIKIPISLGDKDDNKCDVTSFCDVFHKEENLDEDNKFKCEFCNEEQAGKISHHMIEAPQVLVIYLKKPYRIEDKSFTLSKDTKFFALSHSFKYESDAPIAAKGEYQLYGLVMHSGSTISNGHYYSIIRQNGIHENRMGTRSNKKGNTSSSKCVCYNIDRDDLKDKWVRINDDKVKLLSDSHLNKSLQVQDPCDTPYLAFYWKTSD